MEIAIRRLTDTDVEEVWQLRLRALRENPEAFAGTYEETLANGIEHYVQRLRDTGDGESPWSGAFWLGAFMEDKLVGMVGFVREQGMKNRHIGHIIGMFVAPEARGLGVGKALVKAVIERAKHIKEIEQIQLEVVTTNESARRLYHSLGFETYGVRPHGMKLGEQYWDDEMMMLRFA